MHCISLASHSRLSQFPCPVVGTYWPFCVDVPLSNQPTNCNLQQQSPTVYLLLHISPTHERMIACVKLESATWSWTQAVGDKGECATTQPPALLLNIIYFYILMITHDLSRWRNWRKQDCICCCVVKSRTSHNVLTVDLFVLCHSSIDTTTSAPSEQVFFLQRD